MVVSPPIRFRIEWADSQGKVTASWLAAHFNFLQHFSFVMMEAIGFVAPAAPSSAAFEAILPLPNSCLSCDRDSNDNIHCVATRQFRRPYLLLS